MPLTFSTASGVAAVLVFIATLFYWLSTFSVPFVESIYYVKTELNDIRFGTFGWCKSGPYSACYRHIGYEWIGYIPQKDRLTRAHVLVAMTAAFGTLAFFSLVAGMRNFRGGFCGLILLLITTFFSTLSLFLVIPTWAITHHRFKDDDFEPRYGAAFGFVIVGWLLFLLAVPLVVIGWFRERRMRRDGTYTHNTTSTTTTTRRRWF